MTPFDVSLNTRGAQFTTRGFGFIQAPPTGQAPPGGIRTDLIRCSKFSTASCRPVWSQTKVFLSWER